MAKSFADSLNAMASAQASTMSLRNSVALAAEEESWTLHTGYDTTDNFAVGKRYSDEHISYVDEKKNVTVNDYQVNLTQEENSQYIPFEMNRYYDGIDLTIMKLSFYFENIEGGWGEREAINVRYTDTKIRLGFLVPKEATLITGKLKFEIHATGSDPFGGRYVWKTRPNEDLTILESLQGNGEYIIDPGFAENVLDEVKQAASDAQYASAQAKTFADNAQTFNTQTTETVNAALEEIDLKIASVEATIKDDVVAELSIQYYTREETDSAITTALVPLNEDVSELDNRVTKAEGDILSLQGEIENRYTKDETLSTEEIEQKIADIDVTSQLEQLETKIAGEYYNKTEIDTKLSKMDISDKLTDYYKKEEADATFAQKSVETTVNDINEAVTLLDETISALDTKVNDIGENIEHPRPSIEWSEETRTLSLLIDDEVEQSVTISGGGSGGTTVGSTVTIDRITPGSVTHLKGRSLEIEYVFTSVDVDGEPTGNGTLTVTVGSTQVYTGTISQGTNKFDATPYLNELGTKKIKLAIKDSYENTNARIWNIDVVEFSISSTFNDMDFYYDDITFRYVPYGDVNKTIHFELDGKEIATVETAYTGRQLTQSIPKQSHGAHLLKVYMTATINNNEETSDAVYKDIIWIDESSNVPVIGCAITDFAIKQYNTINIPYIVYDPLNNPASITIYEGEEIYSTPTVGRTEQNIPYSSSEIKETILKIECRGVSKTINAVIEDLGITINPVTTGLVFDFDPSKKTNNDSDRIWTDGTYTMSVSDDFDWTNGGYQVDADGDTYFCIKAGTTATLNYQLFADDAKASGKNFKIVYKTTNVRDYDATALTCLDGGIGFKIKAQEVELTSQLNSIVAPAVEENVNYTRPIEMEFNILPTAEFTEMVLWSNAIPTRCKPYDPTDNFTQANPQFISIGSEDCDVHIYRMKAYNMNLTDDEILDNHIADAKNGAERLERYYSNLIINGNGDLDPDLLAAAHPGLRIIKLSCPTFAVDKNPIEGTTVTHILKGSTRARDNWTGTGTHRGQGTSSIGYIESAMNIDIDIDEFVFADGSRDTSYDMTENSVPESYFNIKVNVASSEDSNNACLADDYNTFNPYLRQARINNPKVRDTMEFHPCVIFLQETDTANATTFHDGQYHFYSCGDFGNSKKNANAMGMYPDNHKEFIVEIRNNTDDQCLFLSDDLSNEDWSGDFSFEFRYKSKQCTDEELQAGKDAWQRLLTWVVNATPEQFVSEFEDYFIKDSVLFHYLFTERHCMVDNRAKNVFVHTEDLIHWDFCFDYDNDTAEGCNNTGGLTLTYGLEDTDTIGDGYVFNASNSKLWCYIRDYMYEDLKELYNRLDSTKVWDGSRFIKKCRDYQAMKPKRLWIMNMRRKYFRTYEDNGTTSYLEMMHGDKELKLIQFETYQDPYISSKYLGSTCTSDRITIRGYTPNTWSGIEPNGDLNITPYADVYVVVDYASGQIVRKRAKRNQVCEIKSPMTENMNDTEVYPLSASLLRSIEGIPGFYPRVVYMDNGVKMTSIEVGSSVDGYTNNNLTEFTVNNNTLLEYLNIENTPRLAQPISLVNCINLEEFYAKRSGITGVVFADGGRIRIAHLPASITSITAKNLHHLEELLIEGHDNIVTLLVENCSTIDSLDLVNQCISLNRVRLTNIDWTLENTAVLERLYSMAGINENGINITSSVLTGKVYVMGIKQYDLVKYKEAWPDLTIEYGSMTPQFIVTFVNDDGTLIETQYVNQYGNAEDPTTRTENKIIPTKAPTVSTDYTFAGWDSSLTNIGNNKTIKATYTETTRQYNVKYAQTFNNVTEILQDETVDYGTYSFYKKDTPTYVGEEQYSKYYLFNRWDKSGFVDGDKVINAVYDTCYYSSDSYFNGKELSDLSLVEIYALTRLVEDGRIKITTDTDGFNCVEGTNISAGDYFNYKMGFDCDYDDLADKTHTLIDVNNPRTFSGTSGDYYDTGICLFDTDKDFVLAIDYEFASGNNSNVILVSSYDHSSSRGFKLLYNANPKLQYRNSTEQVATGTNREVLVLRHIAGETGLHVYKSNISGEAIGYIELGSDVINTSTTTLVFGCGKQTATNYNYFAAGTIHWAKLWFADLGDSICRNLAAYIHEDISLRVAGFNRYYRDNGEQLTSIDFIADRLLYLKRAINTSGTNEGGWASATLNTWLNNRFYSGIPAQLKQLIKRVKVKSREGNRSNNTTSSLCYVYIPAVSELVNSSPYNAAPYTNESDAYPVCISHMTNDNSIMEDYYGNACAYWTRSPSDGNTTSSSNVDTYYIYINASGTASGYGLTTNTYGVLIQFSI